MADTKRSATTGTPSSNTSAAPNTGNNRLVEELPVSFLCVARKLQERPYEPLHPQDVLQAVGQQMSLRPPPYVAQDTLFEFYSIIQGHCNVKPLEGSSIDLLTMPSSTTSGPMVPPASTSTAQVSSNVQASSHAAGILGHAPQSGGMNQSNEIADYRLQMIKQNERHVNSRGARVCSYFNTREGCRRGPNCQFLHVSQSQAQLQPQSQPSQQQQLHR